MCSIQGIQGSYTQPPPEAFLFDLPVCCGHFASPEIAEKLINGASDVL